MPHLFNPGNFLKRLSDKLSIRHDLGTQLMVIYIIFVGLVVVMTLYLAHSTRQRLENDIKAADLALARSIAQETDGEMRNTLQAVRELGSMEAVLKSNPQEMETLFKTVMRVRPDISYIHRVNSQGFMTFHYPSETESYIGSDLSGQDYFQRAQVTTQALISKGSISPITNQPVATAVMPLWDEQANFQGLIATNIKLESLSLTLKKIANEYPVEEEIQIVIIDSAGQIIAHQDSNQLLTDLPESRTDVVNAVLLGKAGNMIRDENGREILYSFVPVSRSGWGVIVSHPTEIAFASTHDFYRGVLIILAVFVLIGIVLWIGLEIQAIRPLRYLEDYSQMIGRQGAIDEEGRMNLERLSGREDQVGSLTNSLMRMENAIAARFNELSILLETSTNVLASLDSQTVLNRILDQVRKLLDVEMSAIVALDEGHGTYRVQASHGFSESYIESLSIKPNDPQSVTSRAIASGRVIMVIDTETDPYFVVPRSRARAEGYRSILAIPLNTQHAPPSSLLIFKPEPHVFSDQEITLLSNFANLAAMAIENAALFARSDTRLQAQTRRLEALIQSMNDGLILGNLEGKILYANRSACDWVNSHHEDIIGASIDDFVQAILKNAVNQEISQGVIQAAIKDHSQKPVEITLRSREEETRHLRLRIFSVTDTNNRPIGYGQILQDITADYEVDRLKSSLITTVSHELRTPLASIKGYTTTLLAEDVSWAT